ncbi:MAG: MbnP family protein [Chitinophagales bacterium]
MRISFILFLCGITTITSCTKPVSITVNHGKIVVKVFHQVDGAPLIFDTVAYTNAAQNVYSVEKLQYYLSGIKIYKNKILRYSGSDVILVDARKDSVTSFTITPASGLETGVYDSIAFRIGVDSALNTPFGLPQTLDNLDMAWPDAMGGGYHFLKLEGHYKNDSLLAGYAMHIGGNGFLVKGGFHCALNIAATGDAELKMIMNVNEWFRNPDNYDFNTDGVFSMGNMALMQKLSQNGADVFFSN